MSKVKILVLGPSKAGKTTIANILGDLQEGVSTIYRPTVGCRIVDFERDPPPSLGRLGKVQVELWDVSGDFKYEKCWAPIQQDVQGAIFVYDPSNPESEDDLKRFVEQFPKALRLKQAFCLCYINNHGGEGVDVRIPTCMNALEKYIGTAEDSAGIFQTFEKYLNKLLKMIIEKQAAEEANYA